MRCAGACVAGDEIEGLDARPPLDLATLDATDRVVAMAGVHPYIKLLDQGADVIIGGRSSDCAIFAAPAIRRGFPEGLAYLYGKLLECASFCAEPYAAKESVVGEITMEDVKVTAMCPSSAARSPRSPGMRCTSGANPFYEYFLGGHIDMSRVPLRAIRRTHHPHHRTRNSPGVRMAGQARRGRQDRRALCRHRRGARPLHDREYR